MPGHLLRLRNAEHAQNSWRNVAQGAVGAETKLFVFSAHDDERHRIRGVRGVRTTCDRINQHFGIAVVGGDEHSSTFAAHGGFNLGQAGIDSFDRSDGGLDFARVADHIRIGEVDDHDGKASLLHRLHHGVRDSLCGHFRL